METVKRSVVARSWGLGGRGRKDIPLWFEMLIVGEAVPVWRQRVYEKSLYLPLNFAVNLKLL